MECKNKQMEAEFGIENIQILALIILESFLYTKQKAIANINLHHATFLILNDMYNEIYNMRKNNSGSFVN
ncbi:unnamed protein product [Schistosoma turkestanicum]|nr:unnamed protein product [Schistosoma turkestanicum]